MRLFRSAAAALSLALLFSGTTAAFAKDIDVRIATLSTYQSEFRGFEAKIVTPIVTGLAVDEVQNELNDAFMQRARHLAADYEKDVSEMMKDDPAFDGHMGVVLDYKVRTDNDKVLAVDIYEMNIAGSSSTVHAFYNFDKKSGKLIELGDLFNEKADYTKVINDYILGEMRRINKKRRVSSGSRPKTSRVSAPSKRSRISSSTTRATSSSALINMKWPLAPRAAQSLRSREGSPPPISRKS